MNSRAWDAPLCRSPEGQLFYLPGGNSHFWVPHRIHEKLRKSFGEGKPGNSGRILLREVFQGCSGASAVWPAGGFLLKLSHWGGSVSGHHVGEGLDRQLAAFARHERGQNRMRLPRFSKDLSLTHHGCRRNVLRSTPLR